MSWHRNANACSAPGLNGAPILSFRKTPGFRDAASCSALQPLIELTKRFGPDEGNTRMQLSFIFAKLRQKTRLATSGFPTWRLELRRQPLTGGNSAHGLCPASSAYSCRRTITEWPALTVRGRRTTALAARASAHILRANDCPPGPE